MTVGLSEREANKAGLKNTDFISGLDKGITKALPICQLWWLKVSHVESGELDTELKRKATLSPFRELTVMSEPEEIYVLIYISDYISKGSKYLT